MSLRTATLAEAFGSAALLVAVVGSGVMGEQLAGGNAAIALLANSLATGAALYVLITLIGPISGAHFNPVVTLALCCTRHLSWRKLPGYWAAQFGGAMLGVVLAHAMFGLPLLQTSLHGRSGAGLWTAEVLATAGLLLTIFGALAQARAQAPALVAVYITGAYWFTASTSFANPAVTLARSFTNSFAGIAPASVAGFVLAQLLGLALTLAGLAAARGPPWARAVRG